MSRVITNVTNRLSMGEISGISLMIFSIFITVVIGIGVNNLNGTGLSNPTTTVTTCSSIYCPQYPQYSTVCNTPSNCQFNGTISLFNRNSPFTYMFTLDLLGFVNSFFTSASNNATSVVQSQIGAPSNNVTFNCLFTTGGHTDFLCPTNRNGVWTEHYGTAYIASNAIQFQVNGSIYPTVTGFTKPLYFTCLYWNNVIGSFGISTPTRTSCNVIDSGSGSNQALFTANCWTFGNATDITSFICNAWAQSSNTPNFASVGAFFLFIGSIILLIMSLGIGGSLNIIASGFSWIPNGQGTKFAQVLGMGLLVQTILWSEFGSWVSANNFGYGLNILVLFMLQGCFWFGAWKATVTGYSGQ